MKRFFFLCAFMFLLFCNQAWGVTGLGFGVRGGMISNYKNDNLDIIPTQDKDWLKEMPLFGVHLKIGTLRVVHFEASIEYAWKETEIVLNDFTKTEFSINDLSINATAKYIFAVPVLKPYAGAGLGVHRLVYGISIGEEFIPIPEDQNKIGFHVVGGLLLSFPASPVEFFAEARYTTIQTAGEATRYSTILGGLTFNLP